MFASRWLDFLVLIAIAVVLFGTLGPLFRGLRASGLSAAAATARRRAIAASAATGVAAIGAIALTLALTGSGYFAFVVATGPALTGAAMIAVATVAERTWPRPSGQVRSAALRTRRAGSGSIAMSRMAIVGGVASVMLLIFAALTDEPGGVGAQLTWDSGKATAGPYPGSHYTWAVLGALALVCGLTLLGLRVVDARPALGVGLELEDEAAREASRVRILRGSAFAMLITTAGLLMSVVLSWAKVLESAQMDAPQAFDTVGWRLVQPLGVFAYVLGAAVAILAIKVFLTPGPPMPTADQTPVSPAAVTPSRGAAA
ncbi:hypothetical protein ACOCJ7_12875 [Knoellia sp. CPCC 206453]|uniref:hypothetical protein n=1 Tax=Knoellia pratensis TaxID=3404796 RepID=UPI003609B274